MLRLNQEGRVPKSAKIIIIFTGLALSLVALSPFISLLLPLKFTNRTYYRLLYNKIAYHEARGAPNDRDKAIRLFDYVVRHEFLQGIPSKSKPADSLISAEAYCDYQARTLNSLMGIVDIPSRYAMLFDKDGISPHTLNEVFLDGKWCVFDPAFNVILNDKAGNALSLTDLSANPQLCFEDEKFALIKDYDPTFYDHLSAYFGRMFPMPRIPDYSTPTMYQEHVFDKVIDLYFVIFKSGFFEFFQDLYLMAKKSNISSIESRILFQARNYHLGYRYKVALAKYDQLQRDYPRSALLRDAMFFKAMLKYDMGYYGEAIESFKAVIDGDFDKWKEAAYFYLGLCYEALGNIDESLRYYRLAGNLRIPAHAMQSVNLKVLK